MAVLATLKLTQDFAPTTAGAVLRADVLVLDSPPGHLRLDQDFDGSASKIQPRLQLEGQPAGTDAVYPVVTSSWTVGGVSGRALGILRAGEAAIGADLESCSRTWSQAVVASTGSRRGGGFSAGPLNYEVDVGGPPPGRGVPVSFQVELDEVPLALLSDGFVEQSSREWNGSGHLLTMSGSGPEVPFRDVEIDLELEADHKLNQGEIAISVMQDGGVPDEQIDIDPGLGSPRTLPQAFNCVNLWSFLKDLLRPIGYVPMAGRSDNVFRAVALDVEDDETTIMTLNALDIAVEAGVAVGSDGTLPTCVDVEGRQINDAANGTGTGTVTTEVVVETIDDLVLPLPVAFQVGGVATITPTGFGPPAPIPDAVTGRTTVRVTTVDGCETLTYTKIEGYRNPIAARYIAAATLTGEPRLYPGFNVYFFDEIPGEDDATEGFQWDRDRFGVISETWAEPQYRADGRRTGTLTRTSEFRNIAAADKSRIAISDTWEAQNYEPGPTTASFSRVVFSAERYFAGPGTPDDQLPTALNPFYPGVTTVLRHTKVEVEELEIGECDQVPSESTTTTTYGRRAGTTQLYSDGFHSRDDNEIGVSSSVSSLSLTIAGKTKTVSTGINTEGRRLPGQVSDAPPGQGLRAAEICTPEEVDRDNEQRLDVRVCLVRQDAQGGLSEDLAKPVTLSSRWVETVDEAISWGQRELSIMHGYPVALVMASPAPIIDAGDVIELDLPELGFDARRSKVVATQTAIPPANGQDPVVHELVLRVPPTG
jgi:hypothetical protein